MNTGSKPSASRNHEGGARFAAIEKQIELDFNGNTLTPNPTFFIGCGGLGKLTINMLKSKLLSSFGYDPQKDKDVSIPFFNFLAIDTATVDVEKSAWVLREDEQFQISWSSKKDLSNLLRDRTRQKELMLPGLEDQRVERILNESLDALDGASQVRLLGRTCLFVNNRINELAKVIRTGIRGLHDVYKNDSCPEGFRLVWDEEKEGRGSALDWRGRAKGKLNFVLVSSFGGGTGTGIFIDIAAVIRGILSDKQLNLDTGYSKSASTYGLFVLPFCMTTNNNERKLKANSYAALKELDHFAAKGMFNINYGSSLGRIKIDHRDATDRLFQRIFLFEGKNDEGSEIMQDPKLSSRVDRRFRVGDEISEFLLHCFVLDSYNKPFWELQTNKRQDRTFDGIEQAAAARPAEFKTQYSSFGISTLIFPLDTLFKQIKNRWKKYIIRWIQQELEFSEGAIREVLIEDLGYSDLENEGIERSIFDKSYENYKLRNIKPEDLSAEEEGVSIVDKNLRIREDNIVKDAKRKIDALMKALKDGFDLKIDAQGKLSIGVEKELTTDVEQGLRMLRTRLAEIATKFRTAAGDYSGRMKSAENWKRFLFDSEKSYKEDPVPAGEKKPLAKRLIEVLGSSGPDFSRVTQEEDQYITESDLSFINGQLKCILLSTGYKLLVQGLDQIIKNLDDLVDVGKVSSTHRKKMLDQMDVMLDQEAERLAREYFVYDGVPVADLRSRRKFNIFLQGRDSLDTSLFKLARQLKSSARDQSEKEPKLRDYVTTPVREEVTKRGGLEAFSDPKELNQIIDEKLNDYIERFKIKERLYEMTLDNLQGQEIFTELDNQKRDLLSYSRPYIAINREADNRLWESDVEEVNHLKGGHRNKLTSISIVGGFSGFALKNLPDWRKKYTEMQGDQFLHAFAGAEEDFPELAFVDEGIRRMDAEEFVKLAVASGYLQRDRNDSGKLSIKSVPKKTIRFFNRVARAETDKQGLISLIRDDPANRVSLLDNYLDFMWSNIDESDPSPWLPAVVRIRDLYGVDAFDLKHRRYTDLMEDLDIKTIRFQADIEKLTESINNIIDEMVKNGFVTRVGKEEGEAFFFYTNAYMKRDGVSNRIAAEQDVLVRELKSNGWLLEEFILGLNARISHKSTSIRNYKSELEGYLSGQGPTLPDFFRVSLEEKLDNLKLFGE